MNDPYEPPFQLTSEIVSRIADISQTVGRLSVLADSAESLQLRRLNQIRTVQGSLAIEGNTLTEEQITAILDGKRVVGSPKEIQEAQNAIEVYKNLQKWYPDNEEHLLGAHRIMMGGLITDAGRYRRKGAGVMAGETVIHVAPPADRVPALMHDLMQWVKNTSDHPLIVSSVFHYELEFIHPFVDGNGRMGRLWQTLILSKWQPLLAHIPVESLIHKHQADYYLALQQSTMDGSSSPFINFTLKVISEALDAVTPEVTPQVTPEVERLLSSLDEPRSRRELQSLLHLKDEKHFRKHYLAPALQKGLIEMTIPDKPNSRLQKYQLTSLGKQA